MLPPLPKPGFEVVDASPIRFELELEGVRVGIFEVYDGLSGEAQVHRIEEGGANDHVHHFHNVSHIHRLQLRQGTCYDGHAIQWLRSGAVGMPVERKDGAIVLIEEHHGHSVERTRWGFFGARPVTWACPSVAQSTQLVELERLALEVEWVEVSTP